MTLKDPFLEGTFWDKFSRPIRSRALLFTPEKTFEYPQMWVWPQVPFGCPPPSTPLRPRTPPPHQPEPPPPGALQKEPRGVGGRGKERAGREGVWLEGRVLQLQWGTGGTSKHQLGPDPHLGAPKTSR